jgi:uncharacterized iron-regulated membrane protein
MRPAIVIFHRYVGLLMAGFLILTGITGSLLAWNHELDAALSPQLFSVSITPPPPLTLSELENRITAYYPKAVIIYTPLRMTAGESISVFITNSNNDQLFFNPYTGELLGERKWGDISQGIKNFMPFIYRLHYSLALDETGKLVLGIVALLWSIDCFTGAYLTLPKNNDITRWLSAWKIRWHASRYKLNFDLHRASGLWTWGMLLVLAWSSVSFNLPDVYQSVTHRFLSIAPFEIAHIPPPQNISKSTSITQARLLGQAWMHNLNEIIPLQILAEDSIFYDVKTQSYQYSVLSNLDISDEGKTAVTFDARTGQLLAVSLPTNHSSANTFTTWITSLHTAQVFGTPMQVIVCLIGMIVMMLSYTGVVIWWKKHTARTLKK